MNGIILIGVLSGMIFGILAMAVRPIASAVILAPLVLAPLGYLFVWRHALVGPCLFAENFNNDGCTQTRALLTMTLDNAGDAVLVATTHIGVAFFLVIALTALRKLVNKPWPRQKIMPVVPDNGADDVATADAQPTTA